MKYKVGNKVKVRENLEVDKKYGTEEFVEEMEEYRGKIVTIDTVNKDDYYIEEDKQTWSWTEEMLEDVKNDNKSIGQIIDECLKNPEMILKQSNIIATKAKEALEKVERENKELKATIIEKEKYIEYLKGEIDGMLLIKNKEV